eukprot:7214522-Prymnesium_polylepis.1
MVRASGARADVVERSPRGASVGNGNRVNIALYVAWLARPCACALSFGFCSACSPASALARV